MWKNILRQVYSKGALVQTSSRAWHLLLCIFGILLQGSLHPRPSHPHLMVEMGAASFMFHIPKGVSTPPPPPILAAIQTEEHIKQHLIEVLKAPLMDFLIWTHCCIHKVGSSYWPNSGHVFLEDEGTEAVILI